MTLNEKYQELQRILRDLQSVLVAFSGGVDSVLLAKVAHDALGEHAQAVTARSEKYHEIGEQELRRLTDAIGIRHHTIVYDEMRIPYFCENTPERCYHCKRYLFSAFMELAREQGLGTLIDGSNRDDADDFRPGMRALRELGVRSPLREAQLTKQEIRALSKQLDLETWDKPSMPCLATRFPYHLEITPDAMAQVEAAERYLYQLGFRELRVRHHDRLARIEVPRAEMPRIFRDGLEQKIVQYFKELGYAYVTLDLQGFRSGSLNEVL